MIEYWYYQIGEIDSTHGLRRNDQKFPADRKKNYVRYSNLHQKSREKRLSMIHLNWWCRDQNFRKYFEMRKKNGIAPAEKGFYHDDIHKNYRDSCIAFDKEHKAMQNQ
jgi:hypothetical protein